MPYELSVAKRPAKCRGPKYGCLDPQHMVQPGCVRLASIKLGLENDPEGTSPVHYDMKFFRHYPQCMTPAVAANIIENDGAIENIPGYYRLSVSQQQMVSRMFPLIQQGITHDPQEEEDVDSEDEEEFERLLREYDEAPTAKKTKTPATPANPQPAPRKPRGKPPSAKSQPGAKKPRGKTPRAASQPREPPRPSHAGRPIRACRYK